MSHRYGTIQRVGEVKAYTIVTNLYQEFICLELQAEIYLGGISVLSDVGKSFLNGPVDSYLNA